MFLTSKEIMNSEYKESDQDLKVFFTIQDPENAINLNFLEFFHDVRPDLKEVPSVEKSDLVLVFCYVSEVQRDIEKALQKLNSVAASKPAVLVVLHYTSDPKNISDSSKYVNRWKTITVDCMISEDKTLLKCSKNDELLSRFAKQITSEVFSEVKEEVTPLVIWHHTTAIIGVCFLLLKETYSFYMIYFLWPIFCNFIDQAHCTAKQLPSPFPHKYFADLIGQVPQCYVEILSGLHEQRPDLQEVATVEKCDFILAFFISRPGSGLEAALKQIDSHTDSKPAVLVVLHHTFDPHCTVPDSSRCVTRENMITVDCLFSEDQGLLKCLQNNESLDKIANWLIPRVNSKGFPPNTATVTNFKNDLTQIPEANSAHVGSSCTVKYTNKRVVNGQDLGLKQKRINYVSVISGKTLGSHELFLQKLHEHIPVLRRVSTVDQCDVILVFCPIVSCVGIDIEAALKQLSNVADSKPAVLVVLHHTFDPHCTVPDSNRCVTREKTITVDCLFHEDQGLLKCLQNNESLDKVANWLIPRVNSKGFPPNTATVTNFKNGLTQIPEKRVVNGQDLGLKRRINYVSVVSGNTFGSHELFLQKLHEHIPVLRRVSTVDQCDVILVFCPIVSRVGTDIEAALKQLSNVADSKPAVLVVLHHTFDPHCTVPDSSRCVSRENMITVDCLFHEDQGLLKCLQNNESLDKVVNWLIPRVNSKGFPPNTATVTNFKNDLTQIPEKRVVNGQDLGLKQKRINYVSVISGKTLGSHELFWQKLHEHIPVLRRVSTVDQCDVILVFCPIVSRVGIDIEAALKQLSDVADSKPAVLVVLHHTFDPHCTVPDSSRCVSRENTISVDCLFHEDQGLLHCEKNKEAFRKTSQWIVGLHKGWRSDVPDKVKHSLSSDDSKPEKARKMFKKLPSEEFKYFVAETNKKPPDSVRKAVHKRIPQLLEVSTVEECDVILVYYLTEPISSWSETDIAEAMQTISCITGTKPVVLMVLHHTLNPEYTPPDSRRWVTVSNTFSVDCLFAEDKGLLPCPKNDDAFYEFYKWLESKVMEKRPS